MSLEIIGWLGAICFAICAAPQALLSFKQGHSKGISNGFLSLWLGGEIFTLMYMWPKQDWPIITNLLFNLLFILVIVRYKLWPRSDNGRKQDNHRDLNRRRPRAGTPRRDQGSTARDRRNRGNK